MRVPEINQFITHLVVERKASASTQNQAISAILFLYRNLLNIELDETTLDFVRPKKENAFPLYSQRTKPDRSSPTSQANINSWFRSCMVADLDLWNVCDCALKTSTLKTTVSSSATEKAATTVSPCFPTASFHPCGTSGSKKSHSPKRPCRRLWLRLYAFRAGQEIPSRTPTMDMAIRLSRHHTQPRS